MIPQNQEQSSLTAFFRKYGLGRLLAQAGVRSRTIGVPGTIIIQLLVGLVCTERNLWRWFKEAPTQSAEPLPFQKSTVYALLKNPHINWRRLLWALSYATTRWLSSFTQRDAVLIVDDSLFDRHRSRRVDFLSKVYDHVEHRYRWGFRWLTVGWSDGTTFLPLIFSLVGSQKASNRRQDTESRVDRRSVGARRRQEAQASAPTLVVRALRDALQAGITARYVLFDRWFTTGKLVGEIVRTTGLDVIGMVKASPHIRYTYHNQQFTLNQLYRQVIRPKWVRSDLIGSCLVTLMTEAGALPLKIVFVRDRRSESKEWLALWSTDLTITDDEVVRQYGKRWAIETFFKVAKSLLGIPREYQGRSYEGCIAHVTIVCIRYQWLALEVRKAEDPRTIGDLFYAQCQELEDIAFGWVVDQILAAFAASLQADLELTEAQIESFFAGFLKRIPAHLRDRIVRTASIGLLKAG